MQEISLRSCANFFVAPFRKKIDRTKYLHSDLLLIIFNHLPIEDRFKARCVNHRWKLLLDEKLLTRQLSKILKAVNPIFNLNNNIDYYQLRSNHYVFPGFFRDREVCFSPHQTTIWFIGVPYSPLCMPVQFCIHIQSKEHSSIPDASRIFIEIVNEGMSEAEKKVLEEAKVVIKRKTEKLTSTRLEFHLKLLRIEKTLNQRAMRGGSG